MPDYEQSVFISYAWGTEREDIVNEIDETLQQRGIRIVRDKRALGYRGSIRDFMERIGRGSCIIVVISDKYLRSPNCMFELVEIADNKQFHDRVFPIILTDANIYDPLKRIEYIKFWEGKRKELAKAMKTLDPANLHGIREEMDEYDRVRDKISGITSILKDMNTLTPEMHRDSEFSNLYDAIVERLRESETDVTTEFNELAKKAEAERKAKEEAERIARAEANRLAARKVEEERLAIVKAEEERKAKEQAEAERKVKEEEERIAKVEAERKAKEDREAKAEADRLAAQKAEEERLSRIEAERLAAQKAERERIERESAEQERLALAKAEADRRAKAEAERRAKEEAERLTAQKAEAERLAQQQAEEQRLAQAKADREAKAEADRFAKQKAEEERLAKAEAERREKQEAARIAAQKAEAERFAKQKTEEERKAKEKVVPAPAMPVGIKGKPVSVAPAQKKPASKVMVYGIAAVVVLAIAGIGISALSRGGNRNAPISTPTSNAPVVVPDTGALATPTTAATTPPYTATIAPTQSPTQTAVPTDSPTELPKPGGETVFSTDFSTTNNDWLWGKCCYIDNGKFYVGATYSGGPSIFWTFDQAVGVTAKHVSDAIGGVYCRKTGYTDLQYNYSQSWFYLFQIDFDTHIAQILYFYGEYDHPVGYVQKVQQLDSQSIDQSDSYTMYAVCQGNSFEFYVNGKKVAQSSHKEPGGLARDEGTAGLYLQLKHSSNGIGEFDDLYINVLE